MASDLTAAAPKRPSRLRRPRLWTVLLAVGVVAIIVGAVLVAGPIIGVFQRGQADTSALNNWHGGKTQPGSGGEPVDAYYAAHLRLKLGDRLRARRIRRAGPVPLRRRGGQRHLGAPQLALDGALPRERPNPGQQGNGIIAFHREPDFQYINQLAVGDTVTIQSRSCQTFVYRITQRVGPAACQVTQLNPTSGHELTMITCDPWWQDYNRLDWRAELISAPAAGGSAGGIGGQPDLLPRRPGYSENPSRGPGSAASATASRRLAWVRTKIAEAMIATTARAAKPISQRSAEA